MTKVQTVKEPNAVERYYRETVGELRKVVWPTREEATRLSSIVIAVIVVMSIVLGLFDVLFASLIGFLIKIGG